MDANETINNQKPEVFLQSIIFNDDTRLQLDHNSIVVFTGANNSGKSQVLKDLVNCFDASNKLPKIVIKCSELEYSGSLEEKCFIEDRFFVNQLGAFQLYETGATFEMKWLIDFWKNKNLISGLHVLFVKLLSTEFRLTSSNALNRSKKPETHPIYRIAKSETLARKLSGYFRQAFGVDLVVNRNEMQTIPLHIGQSPDSNAYLMNMHDEYYAKISALPKLQEQGDGMRSFASILLDTFTSEHTITLIDEPEAFLHPPQARVLGKMLAKNNPERRQLFISTHSEDFLQGLLDADNQNVTVIRIHRDHHINHMSILKNNEIKKLWGNPLLRYSNILSGLFHEKVIVCESDYDCLFYQAVMDAIYEEKGEIAPDVLFTHCGGKHRVKDVVGALRAVNVPVVAVCDFDLLSESRSFKPIAAAFGVDWDAHLAGPMKTIYDGMNAKNSNGSDAWEQIKKIGKAGFTGAAPAAYEAVEAKCKSCGLFVVPDGEMECFDKTINKEKKDWVYHVLENYNLATETKLENARKFVQEILDFKA
jgi:energy-coupling factor transporter ATP-binding protein EcfA2